MTVLNLHNQPDEARDLRALRGAVCTINLTGLIEAQTSECMLHMALWNAANGFTNVEYLTVPATLVEAGRDSACQHALQENYNWLLMIDGDATFDADSLARILHTAYITHPDADVVGAYAQLKGSFHPTIDTGTGTWETHYPGEGVLPVIRTGGHFLLIKTPTLRRFGPPWFRTREALQPAKALAEIDNFCRMNYDGRNPLQDASLYSDIVDKAKAASSTSPGSVGEDSGFCDALTAAGGQIYVDTNIVTGHIERRVITPKDLKAKQREHDALLAAAVGVDNA
jgi:hypothetical protein